jgi:hypothetical protein
LLKEKIIGQPVPALPYFSKTFQVRCDASGFAIATVLNEDNRLVAYFGEKLNESKRKYSTYDKEFYEIIQVVKKWRHYLVLKEFILYSENHTLQFVTKHEKLNQKQTKWVEFM